MQRRLVSVLIVLFSAGLLAGHAAAASVNVLGFDDLSCAAWTRSKDDPEQRGAYVVWIRGILTGHNYALPGQQVSTISSGTIELNISEYCSRNPNGLFSDAAFRLSDQFSGRNQPVRK